MLTHVAGEHRRRAASRHPPRRQRHRIGRCRLALPFRTVLLGRACVPGIHTHQPFRAYSEVMDGRDLRPGHDERILQLNRELDPRVVRRSESARACASARSREAMRR